MNRQQERLLRRCNDRLDAELGAMRFKWMWANDLEISMRVIDVETNKMKFDYITNPQTGIVEAVPIYTRRKMAQPYDGHRNYWILCQFLPPCGRDEFHRRFGTMLEYPKNGTWSPIKDSGLKPGIFPTIETTNFCIDGVRAHFTEFEKALEAEVKKQEIAELTTKLNLKHKFKDQFPAFGQIPGTKGTVSFGGTDYTAKSNINALVGGSQYKQ